MNRLIRFLAIVLLFVGVVSCKKHHSYPKVPPPNWSVASVGDYPASMTIVATVPVKLISGHGKDQLGAFINGACRGTGSVVNAGSSEEEFFILIHGKASEKGEINFKFYSANLERMYESGGSFSFTEDGSYGSADAPMQLDMHVVK